MIYIFVFILNISLFINCSILQAYSISNENKAKEYVKLCYDYNNRLDIIWPFLPVLRQLIYIPMIIMHILRGDLHMDIKNNMILL